MKGKLIQCWPYDRSPIGSSIHSPQVATVLWWYYFSKLIEFLDTMFFVLRKKYSQITFLHVYHHASMFNIWWSVLNWIPCGQSRSQPLLPTSLLEECILQRTQLILERIGMGLAVCVV